MGWFSVVNVVFYGKSLKGILVLAEDLDFGFEFDAAFAKCHFFEVIDQV